MLPIKGSWAVTEAAGKCWKPANPSSSVCWWWARLCAHGKPRGCVRLLCGVECFAESMPYGPAEPYQRPILCCPAVSLCHEDFIALRQEKKKVSCGLSQVRWLGCIWDSKGRFTSSGSRGSSQVIIPLLQGFHQLSAGQLSATFL